MKKLFLSLSLLIGVGIGMAHATPQDDFQAGNKFYEAGEYDKAIESYLSAVKQGYEGVSLDYNLGNSYFKQGQRGNAVLWYQRALRMDPRDPDIQFNLSLAQSHLKDEEPSWLENLIFFFTERELGWVVMALVWIFFGLLGSLLLGWISSEGWPPVVLWTSGSLLLISSLWFGTRLAWGAKPYAIVVGPPGEVRNGPGPEYAVGFTIPEGSRVIVLNTRPDWFQVGIPQQGLKGWMPNKDVQPI